MPFTLSHAAAVLPAVRGDGTGRGRLTPALLVAGSFAPDLTYYAASVLPGAMGFGAVTHSFAGVFTVDVLIAWALGAAWLLVREPLVALLPPARQGRWAALTRCGAPRARVRPAVVPWWYVSAVLGALTHVVWDAFTHLDRWGTRVFPVLDRSLPGAPLYGYVQYGGSAVAAVVIAVFVVRVLRRMPAGEPYGVPALSRRDRWWAAAVIGGCAGLGGGAAGGPVVGRARPVGRGARPGAGAVLRRGRRTGGGAAGLRRRGQGVASGRPGPRRGRCGRCGWRGGRSGRGRRCGGPLGRSAAGGAATKTVTVRTGPGRGRRARNRAT
ncbi:hypothetical protein GCM10023336_47110 [Streptomyces similanensis]|uniref:DUF4184 family protein n=1 Tax=Streptomyces similanensis TaxID=1274988 RepID=A0ABP9KU19_9ACTN